MRTAANGRIEKGALSERGAPFSCLHTRYHLSGGLIVGVIAAARLAITGGIAYKGWLMKKCGKLYARWWNATALTRARG